MTFFRTIGGGGKPCCDGPTLLKKRVLTMSEITLLAEVTAFLRQPHGQFIAGEREAGRGAPFAVINPATGRAIAEVTAADSDQADRAVESARQAFNQWREMPTLARGT